MSNAIVFRIGGKTHKDKVQGIFKAAQKDAVSLKKSKSDEPIDDFSMEDIQEAINHAIKEGKPIVFQKQESEGNLPELEEFCMNNQLSFQKLYAPSKNRQPTITVWTVNKDKRFEACGPQTLPMDLDTGQPMVSLNVVTNLCDAQKRKLTPKALWGLLTEDEFKEKPKKDTKTSYKKIDGQVPLNLNRFIKNIQRFFQPIKMEGK